MRVLQLSTHTTLIPDHGGKLRSHHIGRVLEDSGFEVRRIAFCFRVPGDLDDPREVIIDAASMPFWHGAEYAAYGPCRDFLSDYFPTVGALKTPAMLAEFDARVREAAADVVLLEHPWTWPLLARLPEVRSGEMPVVYSSQNVECALKRRIFDEAGIVAPPEVIEGVEALEHGLSGSAAAVVACTRADADTFASWGARRVVLAPNGGVRRRREHLLDILPLPLDPSSAYALAVGSGHPPNVSGFLNLVGPSLPLLRPNQRIVVAGGSSEIIVRSLLAKGLAHVIEERLISLGPVDDFCLDCLIANAHVLLLPIEYGSGSNVKTAEALLSGRPVLATRVAMRGFEAFHSIPGLTVTDGAPAFGNAMLAALQGGFRPFAVEHPILANLLWESTLAPLIALMRDIERELDHRPAVEPMRKAVRHASAYSQP
jgi:glycosyltransferase involved in cell wall biosynthesis